MDDRNIGKVSIPVDVAEIANLAIWQSRVVDLAERVVQRAADSRQAARRAHRNLERLRTALGAAGYGCMGQWVRYGLLRYSSDRAMAEHGSIERSLQQSVTTSLVIAEGCHVQHKNVLALVRKYSHEFGELGGVVFERQRFDTPGGAQLRKVAVLNEDQATYLIALMRTNEVTRTLKRKPPVTSWQAGGESPPQEGGMERQPKHVSWRKTWPKTWTFGFSIARQDDGTGCLMLHCGPRVLVLGPHLSA